MWNEFKTEKFMFAERNAVKRVQKASLEKSWPPMVSANLPL
jgi:hypothetical protein